MESAICFRSAQFKIDGDEDELTNPGLYGKSLAQWLAAQFAKLGYETDAFPEDWGWCVMCVRGDYLLWIGCGCAELDESAAESLMVPPDAETVVWRIFTAIEVPFYKVGALVKKWTGQLDLSGPREKLNQQLDAVLKANESIVFCEEP